MFSIEKDIIYIEISASNLTVYLILNVNQVIHLADTIIGYFNINIIQYDQMQMLRRKPI